jgi:hypothetical protein
MSCSNLIRSSESSFSLTQKLITSLAEKFNFSAEDAWSHVSTNTIVQLQKRFKKQKKANNPLSSIKKPRTSFSFFTKNQRVEIAKKHPKASFGELSKLVSQAWKKLSDKDMKTYKNMEIEDKTRYEKDKCELLANIAKEEASAPVPTPTTTTTTETKTKTKTTKPSKLTKPSTTSKPIVLGNYNIFQKQQRPLIKKEHPSLGLKDINKKLGDMWKALDSKQKEVFV